MQNLNSTVGAAGVGYRPAFREAFFSSTRPKVSWIEAITENYLSSMPRARAELLRLRADFPVALHGIGLNLAGTDGLNARYLRELKNLVKETDPWLVTDHLCWTGVGKENLFDLYPFPYTEEGLRLVAENVNRVQELLKRPIALENITYYLEPAGSELAEVDFLNELASRTDCRLLLDVNNIYVNGVNLGHDPHHVLERVELKHVAEIHLAGHSENRHGILVDTHGTPVREEVWELYAAVLARAGRLIPTLIERDQNIPSFQEMDLELGRLRSLQENFQKGGTLGQSSHVAEAVS